MHRKLQRDPAHLADTLPRPFGQFQMMPVAGHQVRTRLGDADDRTTGLQLLTGQSPVHVALDVQRRHVQIARVVEPGMTT
ncbi:hypothetical protein SDC9_186596 [bioreactor metagenome]|uniref:Uncharacterized protein n=1 Tax=bioreactor metagenome TaxID=1076179 RepID=A0A645HJZ4_9ZZZZ